jgi:hypothetical protein
MGLIEKIKEKLNYVEKLDKSQTTEMAKACQSIFELLVEGFNTKFPEQGFGKIYSSSTLIEMISDKMRQGFAVFEDENCTLHEYFNKNKDAILPTILELRAKAPRPKL